MTVDQFAALLADLNVVVSHHELEACVALIANDGERTVSADAFVEWYKDQTMAKSASL